jgi:hypothetical protein
MGPRAAPNPGPLRGACLDGAASGPKPRAASRGLSRWGRGDVVRGINPFPVAGKLTSTGDGPIARAPMKTAVLAPLLALVVAAPLAQGAPLVRIFDERRFVWPEDATAETDERLERLILPDARWTPRFCGEGPKSFTVRDVAAGAFTRKGSAQKAVLYEACMVTRHLREQGIAVLEDGRVVAHLSFAGVGDIAIGALPDIDGNGLSELLVYDFANGQGTAYSTVRLLELGTKGVRKLGRFMVHEDDCGAREHGREIATVLHASPDATPTFFEETFTRRCGSQGPWRPRSAQAPAVPAIDDNDTYLRLL